MLSQARDHLTDKGVMVMEVGRQRVPLELEYPGLDFHWLATEGTDEYVFLLRREELDVAANQT